MTYRKRFLKFGYFRTLLRSRRRIFTGTPAGVGRVVSGDKITYGIDGLHPISRTVENTD